MANKQNINVLFRSNNPQTKSHNIPKQYKKSKDCIQSWCQALTRETQKYNPEKTANSIQKYLDSADKLDRILYSDISNYIFSLDTNKRGIYNSNIEKLFLYSLDGNNNVSLDCRKVITKLYDHTQLAMHQIERISDTLTKGIGDAKDNILRETINELRKEIKVVEKNYIAILGIFAAIILAFVGTFTFSTSVLQNVDKVSTYRLILTIELIGFVSVNLLFCLFIFIEKIIKGKNENEKRIKANRNWLSIITNVILLILILSTVICWWFGIVEQRDEKLNINDVDSTANSILTSEEEINSTAMPLNSQILETENNQ